MLNNFFKEYENRHEGESAVLFGTGPSLDSYDPTKIKADINVGTNFIGNHYLFNQDSENFIFLDYYFFGDRNRHMDASFKVKKEKFCACEVDGSPHHLHLSCKEGEKMNALGMSVKNTNARFEKDISQNPTHGGSVIFHALNFLFYTGVSKIYIVGCDCSGAVCFGGVKGINGAELGYGPFKRGWEKARSFVKENSSFTELISINPVGLKGIFKDIYTI